MSDMFMNKQRRRPHWHYSPQQTPMGTGATASSSSSSPAAAATNRKSRSSRACTPGATAKPSVDDYLANEIDDNDDDVEGINANQEENEIEDDPLANILSLQLRKPDHWKWELSTSKSCSNIALPRIILYDHKGNLLVDAPPGGGPDCSEKVYKQDDHVKSPTKKRSYNQQRAATTNLTHSIRKALDKEFNGLRIQEVNTSTSRSSLSSKERRQQTSILTTPSTTSTNTTMRPHRSRKAIDLNIADLPDMSPRSSSLKGVRFNFDNDESKIPDFLPTPPSTTTPTSSSSGPREKRKYRRSHSTGRPYSRSESILERISFQRGRFSSPESEEEEEQRATTASPGPRLCLRTDEAGTLIVHQDSLSSQSSRRRRKPLKYPSSGESVIKSESSSKHLSLTPPQKDAGSPLSEASTTASTKERRRKLLPIRRYLTDGNLLLNKRLSSSEETLAKPTIVLKTEEVPEPDPPVQSSGCNCIHHRRYRRNETKDLNPSISSIGQQRNGKIR
ncbi:uncharacterized protein LOC142229462 [Haematobia irritans]|uniref:uncharacterized protein LOC142229462 n=1 Tax=Haematobia irritans TaxID=7368 RepID=UPI003F50A30B